MSPEIKLSKKGELWLFKPETEFAANITGLEGQTGERRVISEAAEATERTPAEIGQALRKGETISW